MPNYTAYNLWDINDLRPHASQWSIFCSSWCHSTRSFLRKFIERYSTSNSFSHGWQRLYYIITIANTLWHLPSYSSLQFAWRTTCLQSWILYLGSLWLGTSSSIPAAMHLLLPTVLAHATSPMSSNFCSCYAVTLGACALIQSITHQMSSYGAHSQTRKLLLFLTLTLLTSTTTCQFTILSISYDRSSLHSWCWHVVILPH